MKAASARRKWRREKMAGVASSADITMKAKWLKKIGG